MVLASHMICFGFMFPSLYGVYDLICKDANTYSNYEDHACVFQSTLLSGWCYGRVLVRSTNC
jgi:hypothetical protein